MDEIRTKAKDMGQDELLVPTDVLMATISRAGCATLSHASTCINRHVLRLREIAGESDAARRQMIGSIMDFWQYRPQVGIHVSSILVNYGVIAPIDVVQWALSVRAGSGEGLAVHWVFEMVQSSVEKLSRKVRSDVEHRLKFDTLPEEQLARVDEVLNVEREQLRAMLSYIVGAVDEYAEGKVPKLQEKQAAGELSDEDAERIRDWARRWRAVFQRRTQVEEALVREAAVGTRLKLKQARAELKKLRAAEQEDTDVAMG